MVCDVFIAWTMVSGVIQLKLRYEYLQMNQLSYICSTQMEQLTIGWIGVTFQKWFPGLIP